MKRHLICLLLVGVLGVCSCDQSDEYTPTTVLNAFDQMFASAVDVSWQGASSDYVVTFYLPRPQDVFLAGEYEAWYTGGGECISAMRDIPLFSDLPVEVQVCFNQTHYAVDGWSVASISQINRPRLSVGYLIQLQKRGYAPQSLFVSEEGMCLFDGETEVFKLFLSKSILPQQLLSVLEADFDNLRIFDYVCDSLGHRVVLSDADRLYTYQFGVDGHLAYRAEEILSLVSLPLPVFKALLLDYLPTWDIDKIYAVSRAKVDFLVYEVQLKSDEADQGKRVIYFSDGTLCRDGL